MKLAHKGIDSFQRQRRELWKPGAAEPVSTLILISKLYFRVGFAPRCAGAALPTRKKFATKLWGCAPRPAHTYSGAVTV